MEPRGDCMSELGVISASGGASLFCHHGSEFLTGLSESQLPLATHDYSLLGVTKSLGDELDCFVRLTAFPPAVDSISAVEKTKRPREAVEAGQRVTTERFRSDLDLGL